jgi:hypothetical protein
MEKPLFVSGDQVLVPVDLDIPHCTLLGLMGQKICKKKIQLEIKVVHLFATVEPSYNTMTGLSNFCGSHGLKFDLMAKRTRMPNNITDLKNIWCETAIEFKCNKVAVPDSLDFLDATILANMANEGVFTGPAAYEVIRLTSESPAISIVRPLCLFTDEDIELFGTEHNCQSAPTGISIPEADSLGPAREALRHLTTPVANIKLNFFMSQYKINEKFIGAGTDDSHFDGEDETED